MTVGDRIKAIRKEKGMTQKQLADACGMYDSAIRRYESDRQRPKISTLEKIAAALDVNILELYDVPPMVKMAMNAQKIDMKQVKTIADAINAVDGLAAIPVYDFLTDETPETVKLKNRLQANFDAVNLDGQRKITEYSDDIASSVKYKNDKE